MSAPSSPALRIVTLGFGLLWATTELWLFGARPHVLPFCLAVILSVPASVADKARRSIHQATAEEDQ